MGKSAQEVAEALAVGLPKVYNWRARWRSGGLEALANRPKTGAGDRQILERQPLAALAAQTRLLVSPTEV